MLFFPKFCYKFLINMVTNMSQIYLSFPHARVFKTSVCARSEEGSPYVTLSKNKYP